MIKTELYIYIMLVTMLYTQMHMKLSCNWMHFKSVLALS